MPQYQVGNAVYESDKPLSDNDLTQLAGGGQQAPSQQTAPAPQQSNVATDLQQASNSDFSSPTGGVQAPQQASQPGAPQDLMGGLINAAGQFGKGVYSNPIVHPALKALGNWAGANPEEAYGNLPDPQGLGQQVASGLGSAVPLLATAGPMGLGIDAATGVISAGAKAIPILGKMTSLLGDSQLAKSALTGLAYGATEAKAMQMQGQQADIGQSAIDTAGQFLFWSALSKGGASAAAKLLPKGVLNQPDLIKSIPLVGNATKHFFTPEGLGSIAGGALAGALQSPDSKTGVAGAIIGGALSAMNPAEQFQFRQGIGKTLGFGGISAITDHMGKSFAEANDIFEKFGFNDVVKAGNNQQQVPNPVGGTDTLATPQLVAQGHMDALNQIKTQKQGLFDTALQANENIKPQSVQSFTNLLRQRVNEIQDPTSPVVRNFNKTYDALQGFQSAMSETEIPGTKERPTSAPNLRQVTMRDLPPSIRTQITAQQPSLSLNALHQLKMSMQEMVSPEVWAGNRAMTPEERDANGIAQQISGYIGKNNPAYADASRQYAIFKKVQGKAYDLDGAKLAQNMLTMETVKRNERENDLNQISKYLTDNGQAAAASTNLLKKYYAYQVYNNPQTTGFVKSYPVREVSTASMAALLHFAGVPGGALIGGLMGWNMSNPQAWLPVLKGASMAKDMKIFRSIAPKLLPTRRQA